MNKIQTDYFTSRNNETHRKLRRVLRELPDFAQDFFVGIEQNTSLLTRLNYAYDLRLFFQYLTNETTVFGGKKINELELSDLDRIKTNHIERFLSFITNYEDGNTLYTNSERGKARKLSAIKSFFKYFFKRDEISFNSASKVDMPKLHEKPIIRLEADEVVKLLNVAEDGSMLTDRQKMYHEHTKLRDVAILTLMLGTGIRVSECVGLNIPDVDFSTNGIRITRKGGNTEVLYFSDEVKEALVNYLEQRLENPFAKNEPALFLSMQNRRISVRAVELLVKKYASKSTPLKKITPHKLRSTYGTSLYHETNDIYVVADVLGHKDVNTTKKHYAAVSDDIRRSVAQKVKLRDD